MLELTGYRNLEKITDRAQYAIYSALREDATSVFLKVLRSDRPSPSMLAPLYHECKMVNDLNLPGIVRVYGIIEYRNQYVSILENNHEVLLDLFLKDNPLKNLSSFFSLAIEMARLLSDLHQHSVIHKDVNPCNFFINTESLQLKLTGLNFSSKLTHEAQDVVPIEKLEGTLAYMAPEQSGRMNRNIDYRSDYYSLGVTFYQMLTGRLPYTYDDPLELLHAHLAEPVPEASSIHFDIPPILVALVQKLMAKNSDERYQSAIGLQMDLELCRKLFDAEGKIEPFPLGRHDIFDRLNLSEKLYGREDEIKTILEKCDLVAQGRVEVLMISGHSGIGKTRLINEVHKPMVKQKGYFISGKFDQLQRNTPYTAITQAFNQLALLILGEPEERFHALKRVIQEALGGVGQLMIELAPVLERIIGAQAPLDKLPPREAENRMKIFFQRFLGAIAQPNHPLVIFIDDLQWIDAGSLSLLEYLMTDENLSHVLLIGSYRANEVDEFHPLQRFFKQMTGKGKKIHELHLRALTTDHFDALFRDTFHRDAADIRSLSELVYKKTNGNPFFCKQIVNLLYTEKLLYFDYQAHRWDWNLEKILTLQITDNVVDLMLNRLVALPEEAQGLLKYAACVGNNFSIETLMVVSGRSAEAIGDALWPAMAQELIQTTGSSYKHPEALNNKKLTELLSKDVTYQFVHDNVQQAAYESMPSAERHKTHLSIAHLLLARDPKGCLKEHLFEVVDHFNQARELITSTDRFTVVDLNYRAATQARNSNAFKPMSNYLQAALNLLDEEAWSTNYELAFGVHRDYALSLFSLGHAVEAEALISTLFSRATNSIDKASLYLLQLRNYHAQGEMDKSLEAGRAALGMLGVHFPTQARLIDLLLMWMKIQLRLRRFHVERLDRELPPLTNPEIVIAMEILPQLMGPAYWKSARLQQYVGLVAMDLQLRYGKPRGAGWCVAAYAHASLNMFQNLDYALKYLDVSEKLFKELPCNELVGISSAIFAPINNFRSHIREAAEFYKRGVRGDTESGDIVSVSYLKGGLAINTWAEAKSLRATVDQLGQAVKAYDNAGMKGQGALAELNSLLLKKLALDDQDSTGRLKELDDFIRKGTSELLQINHFKRLTFYYYFMGMSQEVLGCQDYWCAQNKRFRFGTFNYEIKMLGGLALAQSIPSTRGLKKWRYKRLFRRLLHDLRWAAEKCPINFLHHFLFLKGSEARLKKQYSKAFQAFDQAIENAKKEGFYLWAALGNELVGDLFLDQGQPRASIDYFREAHYYYGLYGMTAKMRALERRLPHCFNDSFQPQSSAVSQYGRAAPSAANTSTTSSSLDLMSIIKASQTISGEIMLDRLIQRTLHIISENAGSERALFLEPNKGAWFVVASLDHQQSEKKFQALNTPWTEFENLPQGPILVALRSQEPVVLSNASEDSQYRHDPYIVRTKAKSILCLPILHHNQLMGMIYLENNLAIGVFTQDRVIVLATLASQIAISLENSHHLDRMERLYRSTERFLPKKLLEILQKENIEDVSLGDCVKREVSVLFSDMRNFTSIIEKRTPEDAFSFVNRYWEYMAPVIRKNNGFVGQFQGDAILAIFPGAPEDAVNAGVDILKAIVEFNALQMERGELPLEIGIGISSGSAMIGIIGENERLEQSVISDVTNMAARVESLNKSYGTRFLISEHTISLLDNLNQYPLRRIDKVRLKGRITPVHLYELIDWPEHLQGISLPAFLGLYDESFLKYEQGRFLDAKIGFEQCGTHLPGDRITQILVERCELFLKDGPPQDWNGTFTLTYK